MCFCGTSSIRNIRNADAIRSGIAASAASICASLSRAISVRSISGRSSATGWLSSHAVSRRRDSPVSGKIGGHSVEIGGGLRDWLCDELVELYPHVLERILGLFAAAEPCDQEPHQHWPLFEEHGFQPALGHCTAQPVKGGRSRGLSVFLSPRGDSGSEFQAMFRSNVAHLHGAQCRSFALASRRDHIAGQIAGAGMAHYEMDFPRLGEESRK